MHLPKVSCICPTFNRIEQLEETVECFLRQDYTGPKELVILNDCANQTLLFEHPEVKIFNYKTQYSSLGAKHAELVKLSSGEYIMVWDDDDIRLPHAISFCVKMMRNNNVELYYPDKVLVSYENKTYRHLNRSSFHLNGMWTKSLYDSVDGYLPNTEHPDGCLQAQYLKKCAWFKEHVLAVEDTYSVLRVNSQVSQISFSHNESDSSSTTSEAYRKDIMRRAQSKEGYTLHPHWNKDYVKDVREAIKNKFEGPIYLVQYSRKENKVTVHSSACAVRVEFIDCDTGQVHHTCTFQRPDDLNSVWSKCNKAYHVNWLIKVYANGVLHTSLTPSLEDKTVLIRLDSKALGDTLAWFPYVLEFQKKHACKVVVSTFHNYLLQKWQSDNVRIINPGPASDFEVEYKIGVFQDTNKDPFNFREKPLQKVAADILGLTYREQHLDLTHLAGPRPIPEKYVVIGPMSTMACKEWQNPEGWTKVTEYLQSCGYKVVCVPAPRKGMAKLPDLSGVPEELAKNVPTDLINGALTYIAHCEFFVGLGSGLSWLAAALGKETVLISGFSDEYTEFKSKCHRVINKNVCNSCYNDKNLEYGRHWSWCPRNKNFECTRLISAESVIAAIDEARTSIMSVPPTKRQRILCILPHCSSGGLPQYFLQKLMILREVYDVYVVEWQFHGAEFSTQRNQIRRLCTEFIEMDNTRHSDIHRIIAEINPHVIHFEEIPESYTHSDVLNKLHDNRKCLIIHTSHNVKKQFVRNSPDMYVFPSAYQVAMYGRGTVLEYPIMDDKFSADIPSSKEVLCVGIISPHKNQKWLIEVAKLMPDVLFHFAGSMAHNFKNYWSGITPQANCVYHGEIGPKALEQLYKNCSVLVHPSTLELLPLVFSEALSYGLPILANWLPVYEYASFKNHINKLNMDPTKAVDQIRELFYAPRIKIEPTYNEFKQNLLNLYSGASRTNR